MSCPSVAVLLRAGTQEVDPIRIAALGLSALVMVAAAGPPPGSTHRVQPGETLSTIAAESGTTVDSLQRLNGIADPDLVMAGRVLKLAAAVADAAPAATPATGSYTVRPGDNLTTIASRTGTTVAALVKANGLRNANVVVVGSTLRVPAPASSLPARLVADPARLRLRPVFDRWAAANGVPSDLLQSMAWMESGWQPGVVSSTGAVGIGQLMPDTVVWMRQLIGDATLDPRDPEDNIRMSARYLGVLLARTGDAATALAAYYQGLRSVQSGHLYDDTKAYVAAILAARPRFG